MNEYEISECYELLRKIIDWDSMLGDNQDDMTQLKEYLKTLEERQYKKYIQAINSEYRKEENE